MALNGTRELNEKNAKIRADLDTLAVELKTQIDSTKANSAVQIEAVKNEASAWAEQFRSNLYSIMEAGNRSGRPGGKGSGGQDEQKSPAVDRKEVAVWKFPVGVSKLEFRHWIDTIDTNFDAAMGFKYPEVVLDKVKRSEVPVSVQLETHNRHGQ